MNWSDVAKSIGEYAPKVATVLSMTGVGGPAAAAVAAAGSLISGALGVPNTPDDVSQAILTSPDAAVKLKQIESDHGDHLAQIAAQTEAAQLAAATSTLQAVNQTMQTEDKTRPFSWRDYWGFISGTAFAVVVLAVIYLIWASIYYTKPELLGQIPGVVGAFSVLFGIAATVLGVQSSIETNHAGLAARGK
jgi:hypothetical protein